MDRPEHLTNHDPNCGNCRFYGKDPSDFSGNQGVCRFNPTQVFLVMSNKGTEFIGGFPPINKQGWCGKHEWDQPEYHA